MSKKTEVSDRKTLELLVQEGIISRDQIAEAVKRQKVTPQKMPICEILVKMRAVTREQLCSTLERCNKRPRLGDILICSGSVLSEDIKTAADYQKECGLRLGETLLELNMVSEESMREALGSQLNIPFVDLDEMHLDQSLSRLINQKYARNHKIVPISRVGTTLTLAMDDPTDKELIRELQAFTGLKINVVTANRSAIQHALRRMYQTSGIPDRGNSKTLEFIQEESREIEISDEINLEEMRRADGVVRQIINIGIKNSASDIHLETTERRMYARYRIDGVLQDLQLGSLEEKMSRLKREIVSRIKIMGNLDITERRRPQDGSFRALVGLNGNQSKMDFRISIVPGYYGENVVIRILDSRKAPKSIDELAFSTRIHQSLHKLLQRNTGLILVTGPTGSGKSTTLYGSLMSVYRPGIKILTAEDPIEYVYDKITQCQVNPAIGNTFASFIRAFLRQDPEVILVGEIRDSETAEMSFRAAQTGHLVLSTLHTNDALGAIPRLLGLGVDPGLIGSCLVGVLAQRLVRSVCPKCKKEVNPSEKLLKEIFVTPPTDIRWVAGRKCSYCNHTGYRGRLAVAELWMPDENDGILINKRASTEELRKSLHENKNTVLMAEDALVKLREEKTTLEELARTIPFSSITNLRHFQKKNGP